MKTILITLMAIASLLIANANAQFQQTPTLINAVPFGINKPGGTYVLTRDLTVPPTQTGITIAFFQDLQSGAKTVLDLNGHPLSGSPGSTGIVITGAANITVHNGTIQGVLPNDRRVQQFDWYG